MRAFRAHLIAASAVAVSIQMAALTAIFLAGVPEQFFETVVFRLSTAALMLGIVGAMRYFAWSAFGIAVGRNEVTFLDTRRRTVAISATCPQRQLVILHARFAGFGGDVFS